MTNYTFVNYKNTKSLIPKEVWLTAEHLSETEPLFMTEHLVDNDGKLYRRYRLRTCAPTRFVETLDYDIECPHCHESASPLRNGRGCHDARPVQMQTL